MKRTLFNDDRISIIVLCMVLTGIVLLSTGASCDDAIVRDQMVYETELNFFEKASLDQADLLADLIKMHCMCEGGKFTTDKCQEAAETAVVVRARVPWHKAMARYNAGLEEEKPGAVPEIPEAYTLCSEID